MTHHQISWIDDELVGISRCGDTKIEIAVDIYEWHECPNCKKFLKLRQINEIMEQDGGI